MPQNKTAYNLRTLLTDAAASAAGPAMQYYNDRYHDPKLKDLYAAHVSKDDELRDRASNWAARDEYDRAREVQAQRTDSSNKYVADRDRLLLDKRRLHAGTYAPEVLSILADPAHSVVAPLAGAVLGHLGASAGKPLFGNEYVGRAAGTMLGRTGVRAAKALVDRYRERSAPEPTEKKAYDLRTLMADALATGGAAGGAYLMHPAHVYMRDPNSQYTPEDVRAAALGHMGVGGAAALGSMALDRSIGPTLAGMLANYALTDEARSLGLLRNAGAHAAVSALSTAAGRLAYRAAKHHRGKSKEQAEKTAYDTRAFLGDALASIGAGAAPYKGYRTAFGKMYHLNKSTSRLHGGINDLEASGQMSPEMAADRRKYLDAEHARAAERIGDDATVGALGGRALGLTTGLFDPSSRALVPIMGLLGNMAASRMVPYGHVVGSSYIPSRAIAAAVGTLGGRLAGRGLLTLKDRMAKKKETANASK